MSQKLKIFYLITKGNFGGAQHYVYDLATNLPKEQFETTVVMGDSPRRSGAEAGGGELEKQLKISGIKTKKIDGLIRDVSFLNEWRVFWQLIKLFRQEKPDIIHLNSSKIAGLGALAGRLTGIKKIIFTGHGWAFNEDRSWWQKIIIYKLHWLTVVLSHVTIAVSEKTKNQLASLPFIKNKFVVIHNGLASTNYLPRETARQELAEKIWKKGFDQASLNKVLIIGTIAELHKNKGLDFLIQALAQIKDRLPNTLVWIIGDGEEKDNLRELIKINHLKDQVFLLGRINGEAKPYLKAFDIFTLTSRTEAFPYVILEAGQAGLPIIASNVGGIPEVISDFNLGMLIRPGNIKEIKLALTRLIDNPAERNFLGKNIAKKINKEFTVEKMVRETIALYES
jgi:glycosyltransferase involved in cell wall biosynthesis